MRERERGEKGRRKGTCLGSSEVRHTEKKVKKKKGLGQKVPEEKQASLRELAGNEHTLG